MKSRSADVSVEATPAVAVPPLWRAALIACAALSAVGVLVAGQQSAAAGAARAADPDLLMLLRLMAAIKAGAAVALLWLAQWRLRWPAPPTLAVGLVGAGMVMVSGPALIWTMAAVGLGALTFYAGLATLCVLLWRDRAAILGRLGVLGRSRRHDARH